MPVISQMPKMPLGTWLGASLGFAYYQIARPAVNLSVNGKDDAKIANQLKTAFPN